MNNPMKYQILFATMAIFLSSCTHNGSAKAESPYSTEKYTFIEEWLSQPVDHTDAKSSTFEQQIFIIVPKNASPDSPVFFILGNEIDLTKRWLLHAYKSYGEPDNVIFIAAEHRGYGQSITMDKNQTLPSYITINQTLADFHNVATFYNKKYTGSWIAAGYSYGGGLSINYAYKYPNDAKVVLSSSGAVDYPLITDKWDRKLHIYYGEDFYNRLAKHINYFKPKSLFDEDWINREFLSDMCAVIPQKQHSHKYKNLLKVVSYLPTSAFLNVTIWLERKLNSGKGLQLIYSKTKKKLSREEALTGNFSLRTWRYQQCTETGHFFNSVNINGIFPSRSFQGVSKECESLFGKKIVVSSNTQWSPRSMLNKLTIPIIYVNGVKDPTDGMLEQNYQIQNGQYINISDGRHCPDLSNSKVGEKVLATLLTYTI